MVSLAQRKSISITISQGRIESEQSSKEEKKQMHPRNNEKKEAHQLWSMPSDNLRMSMLHQGR